MSAAKRANDEVSGYATPEDFQFVFTEQMLALQALAFMLTADEAIADKCFVAGLEDSMEGNLVFRQWARAWARRAIIRNALRLIGPSPQEDHGFHSVSRSKNGKQFRTPQEVLIEAVIELPPFERFVFVLSVLEGHSLSDTATLLGCTNSQLAQARSRALAQMATVLAETAVNAGSDSPQPHWYSRLEIA